MNLQTVTIYGGRKITTLEVARLCSKGSAMNLAFKLKGYMIDEASVCPFNGGFHVNVTSSHEDAPTELPGFVLMILAHEASKSAV